ncbi:hypothetical protein NQ318_019296 [Aromia moschata]|uniref:PHD-type domain-containing protein n=1 Tax=Aromia moschata TaxID=1265417 RepID=A0AAV8X5G7_9CUCU|nr:hypothetical protein NQ318_019296 [Aromia moschata]
MGPSTVLTSEEEHQLAEWLKELASNVSHGPQKSFQDHLFWLEPIQRKRVTTSREKFPAAISSASYRKYLEEKENRKKAVEKEKQKRKLDRIQKASEKKVKQSRKEKTDGKTYESASRMGHTRVKCSNCEEELISDVEEDELKNVGCDQCERWYHLMCTEFSGAKYEHVQEREFVCLFCS